RTPPLLADFTHTRVCKPFCEKYLTLPQSLMLLSGLFWRKGRFLDSCSCSEPHNRTKEKSPNTNCVQAQPKWSECFRCHLRRKRKGRTIEKSLNANCVQTQSGGRGWIRTTE